MKIHFVFIGIIMGLKALLLLYISMILNFIHIWGLDILIIIFFGLLNGFLDALIISKILKINNKIISYIIAIFITLFLFIYLRRFNFMINIYDYIIYQKYGYKIGEFGPSGGFVIISYFLLYSISQIFSFFITIILIKIIKKKWRNFV